MKIIIKNRNNTIIDVIQNVYSIESLDSICIIKATMLDKTHIFEKDLKDIYLEVIEK